MRFKPSERAKTVARKLAQLLTVQPSEGEEIRSLLLDLGYRTEAEKKPMTVSLSENIGIYKPEVRESGVYYVRDIRQKERWTYFADIQSIPPKSDKVRIVLLGESVARGFLLDPDYTPCLLLQKLLDSNTAGIQFEVIDLAETNQQMGGLMERCRECMRMAPDMLIFMAGNNWRGALEESIFYDRESYKLFMVDDNGSGVGAFRDVLEDRFRKIIESFLGEVGALKEEHNFKAIFAIPEFNLLDCRSTPGERFVSMLEGENVSKWLAARDRAQAALDARDYELCEIAAREMTELDVSHPLGFEFLADCMLHKQDVEKAREYLETARDTALFCRINSKPRIFNVVRQTLRNAAPRYGIETIDIAEVLKMHLNGGIPGRNMFLDYCHFSTEGMQAAMAAVAATVLNTITAEKANVSIDAFSIRPKQETQALAHLFAAIHNAHWGQHYEIVKYHCDKALRHHSSVAKIMIYYCEMTNRIAPNNLCKSFELLVRDSKIDRYVFALIHPRNAKTLELELVDAMISALLPLGINLNSFIREIRLKDHSLNGKKVDLLKSYYHLSSYDEFQGSKTSFYQARDNQSLFYFMHDGKGGVSLQLCCRVPGTDSEVTPLYLFVNDRMVCQIDVSNKWTMHEIVVSQDLCVTGLNIIKLVWPVRKFYKRMRGISAAGHRRSSTSILDSSFVVMGEVSSFFATRRPPYLSGGADKQLQK